MKLLTILLIGLWTSPIEAQELQVAPGGTLCVSPIRHPRRMVRPMTTQDYKKFERFIKKGVSVVVEGERPVTVSGKTGARIEVKPKANGQRQSVFIRDKKGQEALSISFKKSDKLCLWFKRDWRVDSLAFSQKRKRCLACLKPAAASKSTKR